jgi:hypothetical protein
MSIGKKVFAFGVGLFSLIAVAACGPDYERTDITAVKQSPLGGTVSSRTISVPEGMIVKAHVVPVNDDGELMQADVKSRDETVVEVTAIVNDRDYAFIGKTPGKTEVEFRADGEVVFVLIAEVTPQPAPESQ